MTLTIPMPLMILAVFSALLFVGVTIFCRRNFNHNGGYAGGIDGMFAVGAYLIFWIIPSLLGWAVWATLLVVL